MEIVDAVKYLIQQRLDHILRRADRLLVGFRRAMKLDDVLHDTHDKQSIYHTIL